MQILKRLFLLLAPYWKTIIISCGLLIGRAGLELVPPLFQKSIVDEVITARDLSLLAILIIGLVGTYALHQVVQIGDNYVRHTLGEKFILDLRIRLYAYLQKMSLSFFERTSTGELMSRVTNDLSALEHFVTHGSALTARHSQEYRLPNDHWIKPAHVYGYGESSPDRGSQSIRLHPVR